MPPLPGPPEAHVMDYPALDMGVKTMSQRTVTLVDLDVHIFGLDEIKGSKLPIGVVIASHGRCNSAKNMEPFSRGIIAEINNQAAKGERKRVRDTLVVTMDHRNHGHRLKRRETNLAYDKNPMHFVDMAATVYGGCQDHEMVMTFLSAYLFPHGERTIDAFYATGISLGGNTVWRLLATNPAITVAVPIIGLPFDAFGTYLGARARQMGLDWAPPTYPPSIVDYISTPTTSAVYAGKHILSIHGELDELVPYRYGKDIIAGFGIEAWVQRERGHVCTPEMVKMAADWFWRWGYSEQK